MPIYVKDQYIVKLDVADYTDFVSPEDFIELLYIESAGNILPTIDLKFVLRDMKVLNALNDGNPLIVGLGLTEVSMINLQFKMVDDDTATRPSVGQVVSLSGVLYAPEFANYQLSKVYNNMTSLEVLKQMTKKTFKFVTNIDKTNDRQDWFQNDTTWATTNDIALHSYINDNTFQLSAFDSNNFYFYDMRKHFKSVAKGETEPWILSNQVLDTNEGSKSLIFATARIMNDYGVTNLVAGYDYDFVKYNWEDYTLTHVTNNLKSYTSIDTNKLNIMRGGAKTYNYLMSNNNSHPNSDKAFTQNLRNGLLYSSTKTFITLGGQFKKVNLLDLAYVTGNNVERTQGLNIVTRVVYHIKNSKLQTNLILTRESVNAVQSNNLEKS